jgi:hypothetical protein
MTDTIHDAIKNKPVFNVSVQMVIASFRYFMSRRNGSLWEFNRELPSFVVLLPDWVVEQFLDDIADFYRVHENDAERLSYSYIDDDLMTSHRREVAHLKKNLQAEYVIRFGYEYISHWDIWSDEYEQ